jgi:hypothetical protein
MSKIHPENEEKNVKILFDFSDNYETFIMRCIPVIVEMFNVHLIHDLYDLNSEDDITLFLAKKSLDSSCFNLYDFEHIKQIKDLLSYIIEYSENIILSKNDIENIAILIMKKYLLQNEDNTDNKVSIQVFTPNNTLIKVVSYNAHCSDGSLQWKNAGGHIRESEEPIDAIARELKEELAINVPIERLEFVKNKKKTFYYNLHINDEEYEKFIASIESPEIDCEITHICEISV